MEQDLDLVRRFQQGDKSAFDLLFDRYKDGVYRLACRLADMRDAEDVVSDVFVRVHKSLPGFRGDSSFKTWIYRIALNSCRDTLRRAHRVITSISYQHEDALLEAQDKCMDLEAKWAYYDVEEAVRTLSADEQTTIELHYSHGFTLTEAAEILGSPLGTIKARHFTALRKLRAILSPLVEEDVSKT